MMDQLIQIFVDGFSTTQQWLFEALLQPLIYGLGLGGFVEEGFTATGWFMVGVIQLLVLLLVIGPMQRLWPVEKVTDRATIRTDILYTLIHRLGFFRLGLFFTLDPWLDTLQGALRVQGVGTFHLDEWVLGGLGIESALLGFLIYLLVFDGLEYWIHRAQHQWQWWWQLHSLHHAQRQMTMWSDNRNHLLDDVIHDAILVSVGFLVGIAPGQFVALVALGQLSESFQHANLKLWFGAVGERLWISPRFHRLHHAIGLGHEFPARSTNVKPQLGGANFGVLLPWWDMLFGTANFEKRFEPTGVRDQVEQGRQYGQGFWQQQWLGLKRLIGRG